MHRVGLSTGFYTDTQKKYLSKFTKTPHVRRENRTQGAFSIVLAACRSYPIGTIRVVEPCPPQGVQVMFLKPALAQTAHPNTLLPTLHHPRP